MNGHVFRRGKTWSYKFDGPPDSLTGQRRQVSKGGFSDENSALRAMVKAQEELSDGRHVKPSRRTLAAFMGQWLETMRDTVKPTTYVNYRDYASAYVLPFIGKRQLQDVDVPSLNELYRRLRKEGRRKADNNSRMYALWRARQEAGSEVRPRELVAELGVGIHAARSAVRRFRAGRAPLQQDGGLAPKTVKNVHRMLHRALRDAVAWRYIAFNPAEHAVLPRGRSKRPKPWTPEQLAQFLRVASSDRFYALWVLAATTGMRRSELAHLDLDGLDLEAGTLTIDDTRVVVAGRAEESDGKTEKSSRTIALDSVTVTLLRGYVQTIDEERSAWGGTYPDHGLLFVYQDGRPPHPDTITARFNRLVDRAGLPRIRLHDVRHTYATVSLDAGILPKLVSDRLGHASVAFTLQTYTHRSEGRDRDAAETVAALFVTLPAAAQLADDNEDRADADNAETDGQK